MQVCSELENHVGVGDKTLAEFIIDLTEQNQSLPAFMKALERNGAEFPDSFTSSLHALIMRLRPKSGALDRGPTKSAASATAAAGGSGGARSSDLSSKFPGLSMPDSKPMRLTPSPPRHRGDAGDAGRRGRDDDYGDRRDGGRGGGSDGRRDGGGRDDGGGRGRADDRRGGDRRDAAPPPPPPPTSTEPQLYQVYKGRVSNSMEFGVFIQASPAPSYTDFPKLVRYCSPLLHCVPRGNVCVRGRCQWCAGIGVGGAQRKRLFKEGTVLLPTFNRLAPRPLASFIRE